MNASGFPWPAPVDAASDRLQRRTGEQQRRWNGAARARYVRDAAERLARPIRPIDRATVAPYETLFLDRQPIWRDARGPNSTTWTTKFGDCCPKRCPKPHFDLIRRIRFTG
jgi:hypothetical protein